MMDKSRDNLCVENARKWLTELTYVRKKNDNLNDINANDNGIFFLVND